MTKTKSTLIVPDEIVINKIYFIRGHKVMLDKDLAELYGIETKRLKEQVRRNLGRFPADFMFELTQEEYLSLRSQIVTSKKGRGGERYLPMAFTEHGVLMLSSVLNSEKAVQANIQIMRIYVKLREMLMTHKDLLTKFEELERKTNDHDEQFQLVFQYLKQLTMEKNEPRPEIGYKKR